MSGGSEGYGLWFLVVLNSVLFIVLAASFFHPKTGRDWKAMGAFSAFVVALFVEMYGWKGDPHMSPFHFASYVFMIGGFWAIASAWRVLWTAARTGTLATTGPYARLRHPQYVGFMAVMIGFLLQWPTIPTLVIFPVLVAMYRRLAIAEEREARAHFGAEWDAYASVTPRFIPRFRPSDHSGDDRRRPKAGVR